MNEFDALQATKLSLSDLLGNIRVFLHIAWAWALLDTVIIVLYAIAPALSGEANLDIAHNIAVRGDYFQNQELRMLLVGPTVLGSLAVNIKWMRFTLFREAPKGNLNLPPGAARYIGCTLIIGFGFVLILVPGFIAARVIDTMLAEPVGPILATVAMVLNGLLAGYICVRMWLVFPAIAARNESFRFLDSFRLFRGLSVLKYLLGLIATVIVTQIFTVVISFPGLLYQESNIVADVLSVAAVFTIDIGSYLTTAAIAALTAHLYSALAISNAAASTK